MLLVEKLLGSSSLEPAYIEDVFSTWLYTGNGSTQGVNNGIQFSAGATSPGWLTSLSTVSSFTDVKVDSSGNVYVCGETTVSATRDFLIAKYNSAGVIQWQRRLGGTGLQFAVGLGLDSSNNVYVAGYNNNNVSGNVDYQTVKYDTNGNIQWQRRYTSAGTASEDPSAAAADAAGNFYIVGTGGIIKYDTSGNLQWQRDIGYIGGAGWNAVCVDSAGNICISGTVNDGSTQRPIVVKYDSSGNRLWDRISNNAVGTDYPGQAIATDSSNNIYITGAVQVSPAFYEWVTIKLNSSGSVLWQKRLLNMNNGIAEAIAVDSAGNAYAVGYSNYSATGNIQIVKYDTSGNLLWQKIMTTPGVNNTAAGATIDSSGNLYICGRSSGALLAKLPGDGSGMGVYTTATIVTYTESYFSESTPTFSFTAASMTEYFPSLTSSASSLTDAATTLTSSTTALVGGGTAAGGLVWLKSRSGATDHALYDSVRGPTFDIASNLATGQTTQTQGLTGFLSNGFSIGTLAKINTNNAIYTSWTFREQPRFFDVVTYTGNGANRTIAHNLGSVPGCIMVKRTDTTGDWQVYHRSLANTQYLVLNSTAAAATGATRWNSTTPTSTVFSLGTDATVNANGGTYVAYLFAHDAGGFGATGTDNVISCGSFTTSATFPYPASSTFGWEPQWVLIKSIDAAGAADPSWQIFDNMRGMSQGLSGRILADTAAAEAANFRRAVPNATGFEWVNYPESSTYIYIAIRRGPMRTPTTGTSVFNPVVYTGTNVDNRLVNTSIAPDMVWVRQRNDTVLGGMVVGDRLRGEPTALGGQPYLLTGTTAAEVDDGDAFDAQLVSTVEYGDAFSSMNGFWCGNDATAKLNVNTTSNNHVVEAFRRAPGFFDIVCYTGTGVARTVSHNLGVAPELMIVKRRDGADVWGVWSQSRPLSGDVLYLNNTIGWDNNAAYFGSTNPTASVFSVNVSSSTNGSGSTYVAYLFASCPGVSKVGSFTGTGTTQTINCGFSSGARFVLIKRTDSTGDWYVWDTARGIVAANDPYLRLNSTAAEVTTTDWVDTAASGFELSNAVGNLVNTSGASYIFLAIA